MADKEQQERCPGYLYYKFEEIICSICANLGLRMSQIAQEELLETLYKCSETTLMDIAYELDRLFIFPSHLGDEFPSSTMPHRIVTKICRGFDIDDITDERLHCSMYELRYEDELMDRITAEVELLVQNCF